MMRNNRAFSLAMGLLVAAALLAPQQAFAEDDFGRIVKHIETQYHVHRQHRFVMGMAGFVVRVWHVAGVKNLKGAIFEDQQFANTGSDTRFDEIVRAALDSGWQPMIQTWDRRSGEHTFIYAQNIYAQNLGRDMKLLVVNLEPSEAVVLQVKIDPVKLSDFVSEAGMGHRHNSDSPAHEHLPAVTEEQTEGAYLQPGWDGVCLLTEPDQSLSGRPLN